TEIFGDADMAADRSFDDSDAATLMASAPGMVVRKPTLHGKTIDQGARQVPPGKPSAGAAGDGGVQPHGLDVGLRSGALVVEAELDFDHSRPGTPGHPPVGFNLSAQLQIKPTLVNRVHLGFDGVDTYHKIAV